MQIGLNIYEPQFTQQQLSFLLNHIDLFRYRSFGTDQPIFLFIDTDACKGTENEVNYLEHVQAFVTLKSSYRGNVVMYITSPSNTT